MKTQKNLIVLGILVAIAIILVAPKDTMSFLTTAGGGINLKELNQKDSTDTEITIDLQVNQTTEQNLEQALVCADYFHRMNGFFVGAGIVGGVSTEFGVCCPTMFVNGGLDFNSYRLEAKMGDFKRGTITTGGIDAQYSNFCTVLGEGGGAKNAMQLSFIKQGFKVGFGHQGVASFYDFTGGSWYAYSEANVCKNILVSGGVDFGESTTGYAATKWCSKNNAVSVTANQLGTENKNLIVSYSRSNLSVMGKALVVTVSGWMQNTQQGLHFVTGLKQGKYGMLYAEVGSKFGQCQFKPCCGLGAVYSF